MGLSGEGISSWGGQSWAGGRWDDGCLTGLGLCRVLPPRSVRTSQHTRQLISSDKKEWPTGQFESLLLLVGRCWGQASPRRTVSVFTDAARALAPGLVSGALSQASTCWAQSAPFRLCGSQHPTVAQNTASA